MDFCVQEICVTCICYCDGPSLLQQGESAVELRNENIRNSTKHSLLSYLQTNICY